MKKSQQDNREYVLVYSTDPIPQQKKPSPQDTATFILKPSVRLEKKGRGGKSVTVLFKLPPNETKLKNLATFLKKSLGSGGTSYIKDGEGFVEIQGEHRDTILELVSKFC